MPAPYEYEDRVIAPPGPWKSLRLFALDPYDRALAKLEHNLPRDRDDVLYLANTTTNTTLTAPPPGLGAGEYLTRIRWEYGQAQPGMAPSSRPLIRGSIINPDNAGGPVAIGDSIQNCVALTTVYTAGPTNVSHNVCRSFTIAGPFGQLDPANENLSGVGPLNVNDVGSWRLRVRSGSQSSDPVTLESIVAFSAPETGLAQIADTAAIT